MARWRIYYDDREPYDGAPEGAPALGVQAIVYADEARGRGILSRFDFYCWWPDRENPWDGHDVFGLMDYLALPGWKRVLFGRSIPDEQFRAIHLAAEEDPDFPMRSGRTPREQAAAP